MSDDKTTKVLLPIIRKTMPAIIADQILGVQPMTGPSPKYWFNPIRPLEARLSYQLLTTEFCDWCSENKLEIIEKDDYNRRIIFPSEKEKAWFLLRWS